MGWGRMRGWLVGKTTGPGAVAAHEACGLFLGFAGFCCLFLCPLTLSAFKPHDVQRRCDNSGFGDFHVDTPYLALSLASIFDGVLFGFS